MGHYVYKYVLNGEILYIGKTDVDLAKRLKQHGKRGDNIPSKHWQEINRANIYFCEFADRHMTDIYETELIRRHNPKYNKAKKTEWSGIDLPEPVWCLYQREIGNSKREQELLEQLNSIAATNAELERALITRCDRCLCKKKLNDLYNALYFGTTKKEYVPKKSGIEVDEVLNIFHDGKLIEPYVSICFTPFGDIECIKVLQTGSYNQLDFIVNQIGSPVYKGTLFYTADDDTVKNWNVFRSYKNRGSKLFYPLSHIHEKLKMPNVDKEIERIIKLGMEELNKG